MKMSSLFLLIILISGSCKSDPDPQPTIPDIIIRNSQVFEMDANSVMRFEVVASDTVEQSVSISYELSGITAEPNVDFTETAGTLEIVAGTRLSVIEVEILQDEINEVEEELRVKLLSATNATITDSTAIGIIEDNDDPTVADGDTSGYSTSLSHYGYELVWSDEFDGTELDPESYNYEVGDGCPNLCGWGNNEEQWYTDEPKNVRLENGSLILTATKEGNADYHSARIQTKGKQEFQFGRIDIRAKLARGQGIWPAIWMLGNNIDQVGWPACGEIDIMELVGHQPKTVHGTAHWGPQGRGYSTYTTSSYFIDDDFAEAYHVFSLVWEFNKMVWYVDETKFKTITPQDMRGETYRFNQPFYFIFNIAVGGGWPGPPDATTVFPQTMEIDYVRVFQ